MTALLTDNLPLLAGAPNGIKKLRELILELAVRGKLVPQDTDDEPACELLSRIAEEKARLVAEGKIKKQKALAEIGEDETPFELPTNWTWNRLGNLVTESGAGWSPSCEPRPREANEWGVLKVSAVSWGIYQPEENKALPASLTARPEHEVAEGDFLVSRANTAELVARSVVVETTPTHLMLSDKIVRLKLTSLCERRYVNLANSAPLARDYYSRVAGGTSSSMKNVSREQILHLPFALPPLAEQHRIVAKVDELMALCDRLEAQQADAESAHAQLVQALLDSLTQASDATDFAANWQRLAEHFHILFTTEPSIDALKQTLLQLAVMGKLVPQDPSDESAGELLKRIAEEKARLMAKGKLKKQKSLPEVDDEEKPHALPSNWEWVRFDLVSHTRLGKMLDKAKNKGELRPYLRNTNVQWFNFEMDDLKSMRFEEHELDEYRVIPGDLVICEGGEPGRCAVWKGDIEDMFIQKALHRARPWLGISPFFLQFCLKAAADSGFLDQFFTGATIKHFSGEKLAKYPVPLPPLAEQHRIVAKVDQLIALCDQLKTRLTQARQLNEQLASTLVEQAVA
ncbi:MAG: restriction endonuclease subunit S [Sphingopyxis sp.]|nr:MAG: restriction endonuclease subunit S [Sphingopyxis sp.]